MKMKAKNKPDRKTGKDAVLAPEQKMLRVLKNHLKDLAVTTGHVNELVNRLREVGVTALPDIRSRTVLRNYKLSTCLPGIGFIREVV